MASSDETPKTQAAREQFLTLDLKSPISKLLDDRETEKKENARREILGDITNRPLDLDKTFSPVKPESPTVCRKFDEISPCRSDKPGLNLDQSLATTFEISETDEDRFALDDNLLCPFDSLSQYDIIDNPSSKTIERPGTPQPWSKKDESRSSLQPLARLNPVQECNPEVLKKPEKAVKRSRGCSPDKLSPVEKKLRRKFPRVESMPPNLKLRDRIPTPVFENEMVRAGQARPLHRPNSCGPILDEEKVTRDLSVHQVAKLVEGEKSLQVGSGSPFKFSTITIIDARYTYEFEGGHIKGAINVPKEEDEKWQKYLEDRFFSGQQSSGSTHVIILHCEFSSKRGPALFDWFRKFDRKLKGEAAYPDLYYEHMYLMKGGYKDFYESLKDTKPGVFSDPIGYRPEKEPEFALKNQSIRKRKKAANRRTDTRSFDRQLRSSDERDTPTKKRPKN